MNAEFVAKGERRYDICIDDFGEEISVRLDGADMGRMLLRLEQGDYPRMCDSFHITHLALSGCKGLGIGRRCLQLHRECFDASITAGRNDEMESSDGSHLIEDGPGFIAKMRLEGLVQWDYD